MVDWIINHRLQRESKVHECLKKISPCDVNDLVKLVYDDVDPKLHPIALWSLTAHLEKLEEDGIAVLSEDKKSGHSISYVWIYFRLLLLTKCLNFSLA